MLRRSQSRTLIASAVLLACLTLTGQSRAQNRALASRSQTPTPLAAPGKSAFPKGFTTLLARAHRILLADSARSGHPLLQLPAATTQFLDHAPTPTTAPLHPQSQPSLTSNTSWRRTSRPWAS